MGLPNLQNGRGLPMPRQKLVTADVISLIESWLDAGLSPTTIAEKVGCTLGTLRVRCSQLKISLRRKTRVARRDGDAESQRRVWFQEDKTNNASASTQTADPIQQEEHLTLRVSQPILRGLRSQAALKGISEGALAAMLLEVIVEDDLYEAVLDVDAPK